MNMLNKNITFFNNFLLICLIVSYFQVNAQDSSIKKLITLKEENSALTDVIDKISSQIQNIYFIYDDMLVNDKKISYSCSNKPVDEVISIITTQANLSFQCIHNNTFVFYSNNTSKNSDELYKNKSNNNGLLWERNTVSPPERKVTNMPDYPALAKRNNIEGSVKLSFLINRAGRVEKVRLLESSGHEILDKAAIDYSKEIIFEPAKKGDTTISAWYSMDFNYKLFQQGFSPNNYISELENYYSKIENNAGIKHKELLEKILNIHISYMNKFSMQEANVNYYINKIISSDLKNEWNEFWDYKELNFLVFHDFIKRSSYLDLNKKATDYLIKFLSQQIEENNDTQLAKQGLFQKKVYIFLKEEYPEIHNKVFRKEVAVN